MSAEQNAIIKATLPWRRLTVTTLVLSTIQAKPKGLMQPAKSHGYLCGQPCRLSILTSPCATWQRVKQELAVSAALPPCPRRPSHQLMGTRVRGESCCSSSRCAIRTHQEIPRFGACAEERHTTTPQLPVQRALHSTLIFYFFKSAQRT